MLEIRLLGSPTVIVDHQPLTDLTKAPTLTRLFAYLVVHRHTPQPRVKLATVLYPDQDEPTARRNVNTALSRLRSTLQACPCLRADSQAVQFDPPPASLWLDVAEFERHAQTRDIPALETAVALYRSEFMEGYYDEWCLRQRERLHEQYVLALHTASTAHQAAGRLDLALDRARQWAEADAFNEDAHRRVIELCLESNRPGEARQQFARYTTIWRDELKLDPSPHMMMLAQRYGLAERCETLCETTRRDMEWVAVVMNRLSVAERGDEPPAARELSRQLRVQVVEYAEKLGDVFKGQYAVDDALAYYALAINTLSDAADTVTRTQRELALRRKCDELYDLSCRREQQTENLQAIQSLATALNEPSALLDALLRQTWFAWSKGDYAQVIPFAEQALDIAQRCTPAEQATAHRIAGLAYFGDCRFQQAYLHSGEALRLDEAAGANNFLQADLVNLAAIDIALARYEEALHKLTRAHELTTPMSLPTVLARIEGKTGQAQAKLGHLKPAEKYLKHAMQLAQAIGDRSVELWLAGRMTDLYFRRGETDRAMTFARHYYRLAQTADDAFAMVDLADWLAKLQLSLSEGWQALMWANRCADVAERRGIWRYRMRSALRRARAHLLLGQFDQARTHAEQSLCLLKQRDERIEEAREVFDTHAECLRRAGAQQ
jgi:DNA-binding SARP family transcriptional activator